VPTGFIGCHEGRQKRKKGRIFFFVNKKEAKKTLIPLDLARETSTGPN
jgi:hypothetical protein